MFLLMFYPSKRPAIAEPKVVQLFLLMLFFGLGNVYWISNFAIIIRLFETLNMLDPQKGAAIAEPKVVQLFLLMFYVGLGNLYYVFNFAPVICLFETLFYNNDSQ